VSASSKIEWTDETVNVVTGCEKVSPGCEHCYAATWAARGMGQWKGRDFGTVLCHEDRIALLKRGSERRKFVCSMADVFHRDVPDDFIGRVYYAMLDATLCPRRHTFQVLTKRPERMRRLVPKFYHFFGRQYRDGQAYIDGIWNGVSIESNDYGWRADMLRELPGVRWISFEPLLGPCDRVDLTGIHWAVIGGESGPGARPIDLAWVRDLIARCRAAGVAVFVKQLGAVHARVSGVPQDRKGGSMVWWPEDLCIREYPVVGGEA
jgi:protein gp37